MAKRHWVTWFYGEPIVVQEVEEDGKAIFLFCYSSSTFKGLGVTDEEMISCIEEFIRDKDERTVLSEDIENFELIDLDVNKESLTWKEDQA